MTTSHESFYSSIDGALTPEQAAQALALAESGDTGDKPEPGGEPATTAVPDDKGALDADTTSEQQAAPAAGGTEGAKAVPEAEQTADNTVVLARDGKHTISFDEVLKIRKQRDEAQATADNAQQQLAALQAEAQARADAGQAPTKTDTMAAQAQAAIDAGADADLFGDFSEAGLRDGLLKLHQQSREQLRNELRAELQEELKKELQPLREQQSKSSSDAHLDAIYTAHPNADSIVESAEFKAWVDSQPSVVRNAYWGLFDAKTGGTSAEIVEVFDAYKAATEKPSSQPAADLKAAAKAATEAVRADPPSSLSSIPGGRVDGLSPDERMAELSGVDLHYAMEGKTPEQITAWLNKQM